MDRDSVGWYQGISLWDISVTSPALSPFLPSCEDCCQVTLALVTFENTRMPYLLPYFTWVFPHPIPDFLGKWKQQEKQVLTWHSERMRDENPRKREFLCRAGFLGIKVRHWESVLYSGSRNGLNALTRSFCLVFGFGLFFQFWLVSLHFQEIMVFSM